jgi:hypothetical protein
MDSSRIGLLGTGCVVMILAAGTGCSSSSSSASPAPDAGPSSSGGGGDSGGSTDNAPVDGGGGPCTPTYPLSIATLVTLDVNWPATSATAKGMGKQYLSLLTTYTADGSNKVTGTTTTCGQVVADITISDLGDMATGEPSGSQVRAQFPASSWDGVPPTAVKGEIGGTNIGSSFEIDPVVTLVGLDSSSPLANGSTMWPMSNTDPSIVMHLTYADGGAYVTGMGQPGIEGVFYNGAAPFVHPKTALSMTSPAASTVQNVFRTEIGFYGKSTSCTETSGTVAATQLNNRVVGCELENDGGTCTTDQYGFLDINTTQYAPGNGTFQSKQIAAGGKCSDVLAALPLPTP